MSREFQRAGRLGWYLGVSVPKCIRKKLSKNEVHKKVGNTHKEALINKSKVEAEIQRSFGVELNQLSLVDEVTEMYESNPNYKDIKSIADIPTEEKPIIKRYLSSWLWQLRESDYSRRGCFMESSKRTNNSASMD